MIILKDGTFFEFDEAYYLELQQTFPGLKPEVLHWECLAMANWAKQAPPSKRKTRRGIKRFVSGWLHRAQRQAHGMSPFALKLKEEGNSDKIGIRSWTSLDCLTHDYLKSASFQQYCLVKYGQYMSFDGERIEA